MSWPKKHVLCVLLGAEASLNLSYSVFSSIRVCLRQPDLKHTVTLKLCVNGHSQESAPWFFKHVNSVLCRDCLRNVFFHFFEHSLFFSFLSAPKKKSTPSTKFNGRGSEKYQPANKNRQGVQGPAHGFSKQWPSKKPTLFHWEPLQKKGSELYFGLGVQFA